MSEAKSSALDYYPWAQQALAQNPRYVPALWIHAVSLAKLGQRDKAAEAVREMLLEPQLTLSKLCARLMHFDESVWNKIADWLRAELLYGWS